MEGDVDAFLEEVRSSEKLLQELQERLRAVGAENERQQAAAATLRKEHLGLGEEHERAEQELAAVSSSAQLQDVRLKKVLEYRERVRRDLQEAETELATVRTQVQSEVDQLCTSAGQHLNRFGLNGVYRTEAKQEKLSELSKTKALTEQLSCSIKELQKHEVILQQELRKLADTESEIEARRRSLQQPLEVRVRVQQLQQTLCRLVQEQRDGRHVQQLLTDIGDAEDETTCLRSAATAMSTELQRLEQLLWFNNMEKMKQRMRATARCAGQYHCATSGAFREETGPGRVPTPAPVVNTAPPRSTWREKTHTTAAMNEPRPRQTPIVTDSDAGVEASCADDGYEELDLPQDWSASDVDQSDDPMADSAAARPSVTSPAPSAAATTASAGSGGGGGPSRAQLAQRRWGARRALMMTRRQPTAAPAAPPPPPPPPSAPPLASVRPQQRPPPSSPLAEPAPCASRRQWGRAAAPGRLSYRGPQPLKRSTTDFRTGLQKLREEMAAAGGAQPAAETQKRVRFATEEDFDDEDFL
ncbi:actin cytoskeleton-regulatory complex protein pan1-like [Amphibalanus amphitrite]|uniref:actin cytoskeleton-regulatory complex protein pan1-like n=1 Tax=Amphibalanus amphitrite TaxID=1232801 RepID=UPI001C9062D9|nr:actin cytoskeleton-regulatory complex protein pan1-like [Amphibalanus amphitrite]XP_043189484.1 actin cytoskeleton-regulatory complex protein pan1-like [Amphibalanus amphitrite]